MRFLILSLLILASCQNRSNTNGLVAIKGSVHNGDIASSTQYPATVALTNMIGDIYCSGTLIESDLVLTAAHCIVNLEDSSLDKRYVFVGTKTSSKVHDKGRYYGIKSFVKNDLYFNSIDVSTDYALLRLEEKVAIDPKLLPRVATSEDNNLFVKDGQKFTIIGFGYDENGVTGTKKLANIEMDELQKLKFFQPENNLHGVSIGDGIQVGDHGDSGSGMLTTNEKGELIVIGITSACNKTQCFYAKTDLVNPWRESLELNIKAKELLLANQIRDAKNLYSKSFSIYPTAEAQVGLAQTTSLEGNIEKSNQDLEGLLEINPESVGALKSLIQNTIAQKNNERLVDLYFQVFLTINTSKSEFVKSRLVEMLGQVVAETKGDLTPLKLLAESIISNPRCSPLNTLGEILGQRLENDHAGRENYFLSLICDGDEKANEFLSDDIVNHPNFLRYLTAIYAGGGEAIMSKMATIMDPIQQRQMLEDDFTWYMIENDLITNPTPAKLAFFDRYKMIRHDVVQDGLINPLRDGNPMTAWSGNHLLDTAIANARIDAALFILQNKIVSVDPLKNDNLRAKLLTLTETYGQSSSLKYLRQNFGLSEKEIADLVKRSLEYHLSDLIITFYEGGLITPETFNKIGGDLLALAIVNFDKKTLLKLRHLGLGLNFQTNRLLTGKSLEQLAIDNSMIQYF